MIPMGSLIRAKGPEHAKTRSIRVMCLGKDGVGSKYPDNALKGKAKAHQILEAALESALGVFC